MNQEMLIPFAAGVLLMTVIFVARIYLRHRKEQADAELGMRIRDEIRTYANNAEWAEKWWVKAEISRPERKP